MRQLQPRMLVLASLVTAAVLGWVVDLGATDAQRLPASRQGETIIENVRLPRLAIASGEDPLPTVLTWLGTGAAPA